MLTDHLSREGRLVVLADGLAGATAQLDELLGPWGVRLGSGVVRDLSALAGDPTSVVSSHYPSKHPVVARLDTDGVPVVLTNAVPVHPSAPPPDPGTGPHVTPLVQSSPKSQAAAGPGADRADGPFVLAVAADASRVVGEGTAARIVRTRLGVVGTAEVATNRFLSYFGNRVLLGGLVQWAAEENDIVSAHRTPGPAAKLTLTNAQKRDVVRRGIVLPALAVLVPLPFTLLRLRRG
jgi:hypothetical protein